MATNNIRRTDMNDMLLGMADEDSAKQWVGEGWYRLVYFDGKGGETYGELMHFYYQSEMFSTLLDAFIVANGHGNRLPAFDYCGTYDLIDVPTDVLLAEISRRSVS